MLQRHQVHRGTSLDEVHRRINVRPGVGAQGIARQGELVAFVIVQRKIEFDRCVAGIDRRGLRINGRRDIDPPADARLCPRESRDNEGSQECCELGRTMFQGATSVNSRPVAYGGLELLRNQC